MRGDASREERPLTRRCAPPSPRKRGEGQPPYSATIVTLSPGTSWASFHLSVVITVIGCR